MQQFSRLNILVWLAPVKTFVEKTLLILLNEKKEHYEITSYYFN